MSASAARACAGQPAACFSSVAPIHWAGLLAHHSAMASRCLGLRSWLVPVLAIFVAQLALSGCGDHSGPAADKCSRHAKPASAGRRVNWDGVQLDVPVGWYPVSVCFATAAPPPVGYLTTQTPRAQCSRISDTAGRCGPPIDQLGDSDVLVVGTQTLLEKIRPNTVVAGRPARVTTSSDEAFPGAAQVVHADILLPHHQVLRITAYLGRSASAERVLATIKGARLRPSA